MIRDATGFNVPAVPFLAHRFERILCDFERDMQIEIMLCLELERRTRYFEECQMRSVVHAIEGVKDLSQPAGLRLLDVDGIDQRQAQEVLIETASLLGVPASIRCVM